jgi:hypothetical protein
MSSRHALPLFLQWDVGAQALAAHRVPGIADLPGMLSQMW